MLPCCSDPFNCTSTAQQSLDCANEIIGVKGQPTNVCLLVYGDGATPTSSRMYSCDDGESQVFFLLIMCPVDLLFICAPYIKQHHYLTITVYGYEAEFTDLECKVPAATSSNPMPNKCENIPGGPYGSRQGMCNADPDRLPLTNDNYVTEV